MYWNKYSYLASKIIPVALGQLLVVFVLTIVDGQAIPKSGSISSGQPFLTTMDDDAYT